MVRTAEQHSNLATHFDKLAEDDRALPEQKAAFVRRANWHRMLSRLVGNGFLGRRGRRSGRLRLAAVCDIGSIAILLVSRLTKRPS